MLYVDERSFGACIPWWGRTKVLHWSFPRTRVTEDTSGDTHPVLFPCSCVKFSLRPDLQAQVYKDLSCVHTVFVNICVSRCEPIVNYWTIFNFSKDSLETTNSRDQQQPLKRRECLYMFVWRDDCMYWRVQSWCKFEIFKRARTFPISKFDNFLPCQKVCTKNFFTVYGGKHILGR